MTSMPDMADFDTYAFYSGYVDIANTTSSMHYLFVEAQSNSTTAPLLVWLNGGPGCSSVLGWAQEHGPYVIQDGATEFVENEFSWNLEANVLYIESPPGVGYSYCGTFEDCTFTDDKSGHLNLLALQGFYEDFPEYKTNDLYISGESYGGIYVPYMAHWVNKWNDEQTDSSE